MPLRIPVSLTLGLLPPFLLCAWLGQWQLGRMAEKQALFSAFENAEQLDLAQAMVEEVAFARVRVRGEFDRSAVFLLDNKILDGRAGVHVLQLFRPEANPPILVNRGWLPISADRTELPAVETPEANVDIQGILSAPIEGGFRLGEPDVLAPPIKPQLITYLDLDRIAGAVGEPLSPWIILLEAGDETGFAGRDWQPSVMLPAQHGAYAAQWFGLALAIAITWTALAWRASRKSPRRDQASTGNHSDSPE